MSQVFITQYLAELDRLRKVSGSGRETIVREAFKDLLKAWGRTQDLTFVAEYPLLHSIRTPLGWWEAKDADDDLDSEIAAKFRKGYPKDNIVFSDDVTTPRSPASARRWGSFNPRPSLRLERRT